jgi:hypothetical protein
MASGRPGGFRAGFCRAKEHGFHDSLPTSNGCTPAKKYFTACSA